MSYCLRPWPRIIKWGYGRWPCHFTSHPRSPSSSRYISANALEATVRLKHNSGIGRKRVGKRQNRRVGLGRPTPAMRLYFFDSFSKILPEATLYFRSKKSATRNMINGIPTKKITNQLNDKPSLMRNITQPIAKLKYAMTSGKLAICQLISFFLAERMKPMRQRPMMILVNILIVISMLKTRFLLLQTVVAYEAKINCRLST